MPRNPPTSPAVPRGARSTATLSDARPGVQSFARGLQVLELLRSRGPLSSEDLGREMGVSKRQINRYLLGLRAAGMVEQEPEQRGIYLVHRATQ